MIRTMCCILTLTSTLYKDFKRLKDEIEKKRLHTRVSVKYMKTYSKQICFNYDN